MLHADGGVRARVFVGETVKAAIDALKTPTLYVIMNGKLVTHPECVEDSLLPIALRTFEIMDHEALFGSLHALMSRHPGINFRLSRIPDKYCLRFPGSEFDKDLMRCLYDEGVRWVQRPTIPWETSVPETAAGVWPRWVPNPQNTPSLQNARTPTPAVARWRSVRVPKTSACRPRVVLLPLP